MNTLSELKGIIQDSIKGTANSSGTTHYYYHPKSYGFWDYMCTPTIVNHYHGGSPKRREEDDNDAFYLISGIALGAFALVAGCYLGGDVADYLRSSDGKELAGRLNCIDAERLFDKVQNQALVRGAIKTAFVASAALGVGGCIAASAPVLAVAGAALFTSGLAFSIHKGATWNFDTQMDRRFQEQLNSLS